MPDAAAPASQTDVRPESTFVGYLRQLYRRAHNKQRSDGAARAALAELRRSALDPSRRYHALGIVGDLIPGDVRGSRLDAYLLTAELFAVYAAGGTDMPDLSQLPQRQTTLGASARLVNARKKNQKGDFVDVNNGITRRFETLLVLPIEDLPDELRRFLRLLRSKNAPVDFYQLLRDLLRWNDFDRRVQQTWARHYWPAEDSSS